MTEQTSNHIQQFIEISELPNKAQKVDGLRKCFLRNVRLDLVGDTLLLGIAIDVSGHAAFFLNVTQLASKELLTSENLQVRFLD